MKRAAANPNDWLEANQRHLMAALSLVRQALERHAARGQGGERKNPDAPGSSAAPSSAVAETQHSPFPVSGDSPHSAVVPTGSADPAAQLGPSALQSICAAFGLSPFERDVLLLCAGRELDGRFPQLYAAAHGDPRRDHPTFSLALAALPGAHWSALTPDGPLRRWRLIETGPTDTLATAPLRVDERVLHFLTGVNGLDDGLRGLAQPVRAPEPLPPSQQALARRIADVWTCRAMVEMPPIVQLLGPDVEGRRAVAAAACAALHQRLHAMRVSEIPSSAAEREALARLWEREAVLSRSALLLEAGEDDAPESARRLIQFLESVEGWVLVNGGNPLQLQARPVVRFEVRKPGALEQKSLWEESLGSTASQLNGEVDRVVAQFSLNAHHIRDVASELLHDRPGDTDHPLGARLWESCRALTRPRLDDLAQRLKPIADWTDLVLPDDSRGVLREIAAQVRQRFRVYDEWGFAAKSGRGLGISALFSGPSGTGKTMAAEVLAHELQLDLYRIDLSQVVNKYIGETEKNLRRVFDAAEDSGVILLFDEADALFGKRSEVKDSHDRYANIEVSYLLQRMEAYRGLAILTTNLKTALDTAFLRRIRFVVQFPFPDATQRSEIWRRIFPAATPTEGLDVRKLSCLNIPGGNIRNIALNAAFLAADDGQPVRMGHILHAARTEYAKLEKPLTDVETKGWI